MGWQHDEFVNKLSFCYLCLDQLSDAHIAILVPSVPTIAACCTALLCHADSMIR